MMADRYEVANANTDVYFDQGYSIRDTVTGKVVTISNLKRRDADRFARLMNAAQTVVERRQFNIVLVENLDKLRDVMNEFTTPAPGEKGD